MVRFMTYQQENETRMDMGVLFSAIIRRLPRIIIITSLLLVGTYFLLGTLPVQYRSTASILVEPRDNIFTRANNASASRATSTDPSAVPSQVELIKSRDTLLMVIEKEGLRDVAEFNGSNKSFLATILELIRPAPSKQSPDERVLLAVAKNLKVAQLRGTRVISVTFTSRDPVLAARIANSIANMHVFRRAELSVSDTAEATSWLDKEITKMRQSVAKAEAAVAKYRIDNDLFVGSNNTNVLDQQLTLIATQISQAQERRNTAQSRADLIMGLLKQGKSIEGVPDVRDSAVIQQLSQEKAGLQGERAELLATLLPNHPNIQAISAQINEIDKQIRIEGRQVADALVAEVQIQARLEQSLRDDLQRLKMDVANATKNSVILNELEREAKAQRDLLATYLLRYRDASARTDTTSSLPDVRVISVAAPAIKPSSPRKSLILLAVGIVAIVFQTLQILSAELISGRAIRTIKPTSSEHQHSSKAQEAATPAAVYSPPMPVNYQNSQENLHSNVRAGRLKNYNYKQNLDLLSQQIINSKQQIILVASVAATSEPVIKALSASLISNGKSVAEIDAGSRKVSSHLGISDLSLGKAEFGDVVQRTAKTNFAVVAWGQQTTINLYSQNCKTLVSALSEIFETIIIDAGEVGLRSSLTAFLGLDALTVLVIDGEMDYAFIDNIKQDIYALGLTNIHIIASSDEQARVA